MVKQKKLCRPTYGRDVNDTFFPNLYTPDHVSGAKLSLSFSGFVRLNDISVYLLILDLRILWDPHFEPIDM